MNLIGTPWSCQCCGAAFTGTPPEHGLCDGCLTEFETLIQAETPNTRTCPECGGPVCADCGQRMTLYITLAPSEATAVRGNTAEVSGDGG